MIHTTIHKHQIPKDGFVLSFSGQAGAHVGHDNELLNGVAAAAAVA